jgi:hypothetical protein
METKVTNIRKSEYNDYFTVVLEVNNERFESIAVFNKFAIKQKFNLTEEEFENLKK